jgi:hypothetical protein
MVSHNIIQKNLLLVGIIVIMISAMILPVSASDENYLVLYVIGSDLESGDYHHASSNLKDLADNWNSDMGDVLVIYGGADKTGWNDGLSITNLELLKKDLEDGVVGSDGDSLTPTQYILTRIPQVDISSSGALSQSLKYADNYGATNNLSSANRYLIFWNHGGGYLGFGSNEVLNTWMSVQDLKSGLSSSSKYDIIIFDACQMASLEVAYELYPHADYLLASEENVPGAGLNYAGFGKALSSNPSMSPEDFGKNVITSYISTNNDEDITLSLVRLSKTPEVVSSLNMLGYSLREILNDQDALSTLGYMYTNTQGYGRSDDGSMVTSVDLYQFVDQIYTNTNEETALHTSAGNLLTTLTNYVVMAEYSGHFSAANGVSIASPNEEFTNEVPNSIAFGRNGWYEYFSKYMGQAGASIQPSAIYKSNNAQSRTIVVNDTTQTAMVFADYLYLKDGHYIIIGQVPLQETYASSDGNIWLSVPTGEYEEPNWDGS